MADTKLSDLTAATTVDPADLVYTAQGGASKKATRELLQTYNAGTLTSNKKVLDLSATWNAAGTTFRGIQLNVTDTASASGSLLMDLQVGGSSKAKIDKSGNITTTSNGSASSPFFVFGGRGSNWGIFSDGASSFKFSLNGAGKHQFWTDGAFYMLDNNASIGLGAATDVLLYRDAANTLAQRNSTNVQAFRLYRTFTDTSNLAYTAAKQDATTGYILDSVNAGTGTEPTNLLDCQLNGSSKFTVDKAGIAIGAVSTTAYSFAGFSTYGVGFSSASGIVFTHAGNVLFGTRTNGFCSASTSAISWTEGAVSATQDLLIVRDAANTLAQRNSTNAQESRVYASYTSATNFQRTSIKTVRESSGALSGASYTTTIAIPAYANLIGVTTRVTTAVTGATSYSVGDGSDVDLWGATIGVTLGSQSQTSDFTAVGAVGAAATSRTITLTANGSNFTGGVVEICAHYIFTEAD